MASEGISAVPGEPAVGGESPMWHPVEQCLYWCDIPSRRLHRFDPVDGATRSWSFDSEVSCCAAAASGGLVLALRSGIVRFDPSTGASTLIARPPYDTAVERFNDGKVDSAGRFWIGTLPDSREPVGALYSLKRGMLERKVGGICNSNGLAFAPDDRTLYRADTTQHRVYTHDFDAATGAVSNQHEFARFERKAEGALAQAYGGRPDGAAVDVQGRYWVACFEGERLACFAADGTRLADLPLPVRCPTMPCFGGPDLKTLYITSSREKRPAEEIARQPLAGRVLQTRVDVAGLPGHLYID